MGKLTDERLKKSLRTRCLTLVDALAHFFSDDLSVRDTLISARSEEAAKKVLGSLKVTFLPEGSITFKSAGHSQGEKTMQKIDAAKRRKDLQEARDVCKEKLTLIEMELAGDFEDGATKSAGAIEFHSPDMKAAIQEARSQPAFR
jgi:hypothetical protein